MTSCVISPGTFGTTCSLKKLSCCSFVSQTSATQGPCESSNRDVEHEARLLLHERDERGEIWS